MNLTGQQQQALEHARAVLAEMPDTPRLPDEWRTECRRALDELAAAFDDDGDGGAS